MNQDHIVLNFNYHLISSLINEIKFLWLKLKQLNINLSWLIFFNSSIFTEVFLLLIISLVQEIMKIFLEKKTLHQELIILLDSKKMFSHNLKSL